VSPGPEPVSCRAFFNLKLNLTVRARRAGIRVRTRIDWLIWIQIWIFTETNADPKRWIFQYNDVPVILQCAFVNIPSGLTHSNNLRLGFIPGPKKRLYPNLSPIQT
jgi:hypothetical protein